MSDKFEEVVQALSLPKVVLVHNLARDPSARTERKLRPGNKTGFILDDGRRMRRAGARSNVVDIKTVLQNIDKFIEGVQLKYISLADDQGVVIILDRLVEIRAHLRSEGVEELSEAVAEPPALVIEEPVPYVESPKVEAVEDVAPEADLTQVKVEEQLPPAPEEPVEAASPPPSEAPAVEEVQSPKQEPSKAPDVWTAEKLKELKTSELHKLAREEFGISDPTKFASRKDLVANMLSK
jgi:hypothetical protein